MFIASENWSLFDRWKHEDLQLVFGAEKSAEALCGILEDPHVLRKTLIETSRSIRLFVPQSLQTPLVD